MFVVRTAQVHCFAYRDFFGTLSERNGAGKAFQREVMATARSKIGVLFNLTLT